MRPDQTPLISARRLARQSAAAIFANAELPPPGAYYDGSLRKMTTEVDSKADESASGKFARAGTSYGYLFDRTPTVRV